MGSTDPSIAINGSNNQVLQNVSAGGDIVLGDKIGRDKVGRDKITTPSPALSRPARPGPWRVFLSHTSELRQYPPGGSYIDKAEQGVIAAGHAPVDMEHFPAVDEPTAEYDARRVEGCDVYVGIYGLRWGSPVRDQPGISYTEQEFDQATAAGIPRLIFIIDTSSTELGLPPDALLDLAHGQKQQSFIQRVRASGLITKTFRNPDDLKALVERSLRELADSTRAPA